jgi:hypothetical protein
MFGIDIRLFEGFVRTMKRSVMAMVAFSFAVGGPSVGGGRSELGRFLRR